MVKLEKALNTFLGTGRITKQLAHILSLAIEKGTVSYSEVEAISGESTEDVLLLGWEWRLLLPVRTSRCGEWDDRVLMAEPGEVYEMPNIAKFLVKEANHTGEWNPHRALRELFRIAGEKEWQRMPELVAQMGRRSVRHRIDALQIKDICREIRLEDRVDTFIAILKGAGVMSPKLGSLSEVARAGVPIYELNPCLFTMSWGRGSQEYDNARR